MTSGRHSSSCNRDGTGALSGSALGRIRIQLRRGLALLRQLGDALRQRGRVADARQQLVAHLQRHHLLVNRRDPPRGRRQGRLKAVALLAQPPEIALNLLLAVAARAGASGLPTLADVETSALEQVMMPRMVKK